VSAALNLTSAIAGLCPVSARAVLSLTSTFGALCVPNVRDSVEVDT